MGFPGKKNYFELTKAQNNAVRSTRPVNLPKSDSRESVSVRFDKIREVRKEIEKFAEQRGWITTKTMEHAWDRSSISGSDAERKAEHARRKSELAGFSDDDSLSPTLSDSGRITM